MTGGHGSDTRLPLESALALVAEAVRRTILDEIASLKASQASTEAPDDDSWVSKPAFVRRHGGSVATLARLQRTGKLSRGRGGRLNYAEAKKFFAMPEESAKAPPEVASLRDERMKKFASELRASIDGAGGRDGR